MQQIHDILQQLFAKAKRRKIVSDNNDVGYLNYNSITVICPFKNPYKCESLFAPSLSG